MGFSRLTTAVLLALMVGCAGRSAIKPADILDERTGMTVGALQEPIEFVEAAQSAGTANSKRTSFAYAGPVEWDRMGEITYGLWIHVAPGNDMQVGNIRARGAVTLQLDDGPMVLSPIDEPASGEGPYRPVVSWGQTSYFELNPAMLKRIAGSTEFVLDLRSVDDTSVKFLPSHETRTTLTQFARTRGITDD